MDIEAKIVELENILLRYANCCMVRDVRNAKAVRDEWRQATRDALEAAYMTGYDDTKAGRLQ